jgi:hypothetical protein
MENMEWCWEQDSMEEDLMEMDKNMERRWKQDLMQDDLMDKIVVLIEYDWGSSSLSLGK